jgi:EAL domain-containing protein (putative c-di-GMP-specific phosphodiesterase class I)/ActR/RegA family two-component response regulator
MDARTMTGNRLLILDDDPHALRLLSNIGRDHAYDVIATSTVAELLDAFGTVAPTMIVLDLQYSEGDGFEVMAALKERRCTVPIILVSGFDQRVLETARKVGEASQLRIIGALKKPVHLSAIKPLLDRHREPTEAEWGAEIENGLLHEQFSVHYQPKVETESGRVLGFEALARWHHPRHGMVSPDRFIGVAEATGQIEPLTDYVLTRSIADCAQWVAAGFDLTVAVNIAAPILATPRILDQVIQLLDEHQLPSSRIVLEVTEGTAMQQPRDTMAMLGRLRLHGVGLSLDDFGTGFSNLALLYEMPFTELKIDRRFVTNVATNHNSQVIVRALHDLAGHFGLTTVAEGVEDDEAWQWLREAGIHQLQGFGIARPMPANRVLPWLRETSSPGSCLSVSDVA